MQSNLQRLRIYLDTCCLSRFFDIQTQARIQQETEVIDWIMDQFQLGNFYWISSDALAGEVEQTPDLDQRLRLKGLITDAQQTVSVGASEISRGGQLETFGFNELDALHIACAESGSADIFLTTDDKLLRRAERYNSQLYVRIENPYTWFQGMTGNERDRTDR